MSAFEPRPVCRDCGRPQVAWVPADRDEEGAPGGAAPQRSWVPTAGSCFCDRRTSIPTRTRFLLLQHPRERDVAIGTARMAHLALPNSRLRVGLDFDHDAEVRGELAASGAAYVLFPGPEALPVERLPRDRPLTLVVLDGTWWQARKLLRLNPAIAALPRVAFRPRSPSGYLIRREPAAHCVSTIEALAEVLAALEPSGEAFDRLLDPFHAMVARQRWFQSEVRASRHRLSPRRARASSRLSLADRLAVSWARLVCIHGEANAWPRHHPGRPEPETIHWVAHRPATGETFDAVVAPRRALGPATHRHVALPDERILAGGTVEEWRRAWREYLRPDDTLVFWGSFYRDLAAAEGLPLALPAIDLRTEASRLLRRSFGGIEASLDLLGGAPAPLAVEGRGGRRLAALVGALEALRAPRTIAATR